MIKVVPEWPTRFPYILQFKSEFCNKVFMIWATVSSRFFFFFFSDSIALLNLWLQRIHHQSDFGIDHFVMFLCSVIFCVAASGCLLQPIRSLGKTLLAFALLQFAFLGQLACYSIYLLISYFVLTILLYYINKQEDIISEINVQYLEFLEYRRKIILMIIDLKVMWEYRRNL